MSRRAKDPMIVALHAFQALSDVEKEALQMTLLMLREAEKLPVVTRKRTPPALPKKEVTPNV